MSYYFDIEDFGTYCRSYADAILKQMANEVKANKEKYYQQNGTYDGYTPKQETLFFTSDGSISIYLYNNDLGIKTLFDFGEYCCENRFAYILNTAKEKLGLFTNLDVTSFIWDAENQSCRWKPIQDVCEGIDIKKIVLNPIDDDGAAFIVENGDKTCDLKIEFSYLFKYDCDSLSSLLTKPDVNPETLEKIKYLENTLAKQKAECAEISDKIKATTLEYNKSYYSLENGGKFYCINEQNGGLSQLQALLGLLKYNKFINGEANSYTTNDFAQFMTLNNQSIQQNNKELMFECNVPYGYKSNLKLEINELTVEQTKCNDVVKKLEAELAATQTTTTTAVECSQPINALETFDASVTLDVIESDGSLTTVSEFDLFPQIGVGGLYQYLIDNQENSGFYFCSYPKPTETWTTGCTTLIAHELSYPNLTPDKEEDLNVSSCKIVKDSLLSGLLSESPFSTGPNDVSAFKQSLNKRIFSSNWLNFSVNVDDETIINLIKNKKIKISIKINNSCSNVCVYIDNIKLIKNCVDGNGKSITVNQSPGFELERVIDNKKSWVNNTVRVNRDFDIENISNLTVFRKTDYDVNDERLVINTKEIDLHINIASAIENDVQCFINDNPNILDSIPTNDCGCELYECYEDVFEIITYEDALNDGIIPAPVDPEDILTTARAVRDAWLKAWNQLMLATPPYLDLKDALYYPNPSEDVITVYKATRNAWIKALSSFNLASGGGFIEGLTVDGQLSISAINSYINKTYNNYEKIAPQMFNTKCGRIFKVISEGGYLYFVESPTKELKVYWANENFAPRNTTWIDLTAWVQEDYAPYVNTTPSFTMEKAPFFCKFMMPNNYQTNIQMLTFEYQTNNNTAHDVWTNPVEDTFFIEWDSAKGKCMTNKFKQVVGEQFSMNFPIISKNLWENYEYTVYSPECYIDVYLRNSGSTACTSCCSVDFTWPNVSADIATINRAHRDHTFKIINETKLAERTPLYNVYVVDPTTNMAPDETSGNIPVKVTTTIRKGARDGEIVYKEEYVVNDSGATCTLFDDTTGLKQLRVVVGIADPNSAYWNSNAYYWNYNGTGGCVTGDFGTILSGSTSGLPLAGASDNATDRNWDFDNNYYVHFDVVNTGTSQVYTVLNNDFNLKDRTLPIVPPASASTQTFDINTAISSINSFKTTILGQIQEDLDYALNNCTNC